jgi:hypothetical protein
MFRRCRQSNKASNGFSSKYNWDTDTFEDAEAGFARPEKKPEPKRETALNSKYSIFFISPFISFNSNVVSYLSSGLCIKLHSFELK